MIRSNAGEIIQPARLPIYRYIYIHMYKYIHVNYTRTRYVYTRSSVCYYNNMYIMRMCTDFGVPPLRILSADDVFFFFSNS